MRKSTRTFNTIFAYETPLTHTYSSAFARQSTHTAPHTHVNPRIQLRMHTSIHACSSACARQSVNPHMQHHMRVCKSLALPRPKAMFVLYLDRSEDCVLLDVVKDDEPFRLENQWLPVPGVTFGICPDGPNEGSMMAFGRCIEVC